MPPQQPDRLLDLFDQFLGFGAHYLGPSAGRESARLGPDVARSKQNTSDLQWEMRCQLQCKTLTGRRKTRRHQNNGKQ
jgi:hypothetical protein